MNYRIVLVLIALLAILGGAFAYQGFNTYYYTDNYQPTVYYSSPYATGYGYLNSYYPNYSYYNSYYPTSYNRYNSYYPTVYSPNYYGGYAYSSYYPTSYNSYYPNYVQPAGRTLSIYSGGSGWGISYSSNSMCVYYGYC